MIDVKAKPDAPDTPDTVVTDPEATRMHVEAGEASDAVAAMLAANAAAFARIGARLRARPPELVVTCARGSSDHAATYGKYLIETLAGVTTASAALSVSSLYDPPAAPAGPGATERLCIAISQSGRSPDLIASVEAQRAAGAYVVALVNVEDAPLGQQADEVIVLKAAPETSVAATKSYLSSLAALAALVAAWTGDDDLHVALAGLPAAMTQAFAQDWSSALPRLDEAASLFVIGRGYTFGAAQEAALKLKETCAIHAECFSSAEVKHGPMAIVGEGFPILAFAGSDAAGNDVRETAALFAERGARVALADSKGAGSKGGAGTLPTAPAHPVIEPILMVQSFYRLAAQLSVARGLNPDQPPFLAKVTRTL